MNVRLWFSNCHAYISGDAVFIVFTVKSEYQGIFVCIYVSKFRYINM
jgi:hypothetical protein